MASYSVDNERIIVVALPEKFPNQATYCQDFNRYKSALQAKWPKVFKAVDDICQTME
jgi:hypothetical protein